jgi:hypothetical protein
MELFPFWEIEKNKIEIHGMFFRTKNKPSTHHKLHAFHHNFTTKTPQPKHPFFQNTP